MNSISEPLKNFYARIASLKGTLYHIDISLTNYSKIYIEQTEKYRENIPDFALGSNLVISDITGPTDNGWDYVFPTNGKHIVKLSSYQEEVSKLIEREVGHALSQAHEAFSTFLKDQIISYIQQNSACIEKLNGKKLELVRNLMQNLRLVQTGKNNSILFKTLKFFAPALHESEKVNNKKIDFSIWYLAFSYFRHKNTHSSASFSLNDQDYLKLDKKVKDYLMHFFPYEKAGEACSFSLKRKTGDENMKLLSEFAFLIFKELSIQLDEEWKILKNMKEVHLKRSADK